MKHSCYKERYQSSSAPTSAYSMPTGYGLRSPTLRLADSARTFWISQKTLQASTRRRPTTCLYFSDTTGPLESVARQEPLYQVKANTKTGRALARRPPPDRTVQRTFHHPHSRRHKYRRGSHLPDWIHCWVVLGDLRRHQARHGCCLHGCLRPERRPDDQCEAGRDLRGDGSVSWASPGAVNVSG